MHATLPVMVSASFQTAVNFWRAAGRLASLTYSSSSPSSLANRSPGLWSWGVFMCLGNSSGDRAVEQEQVWGVSVLGSSLALSGYRFNTRRAIKKKTTWIHRTGTKQIQTKFVLSGSLELAIMSNVRLTHKQNRQDGHQTRTSHLGGEIFYSPHTWKEDRRRECKEKFKLSILISYILLKKYTNNSAIPSSQI